MSDDDKLPDDLSDRLLATLARLHPARPRRQELIDKVLTDIHSADAQTREALAKRLGRLISAQAVDERLALNDAAARVGLSGRALIGIMLNVEALRSKNISQHIVIDQIFNETSKWTEEMWGKQSENYRPIPPIVLRDASIVHGSDQFDILLTVLHAKATLIRPDRNEREDIIYYYVREILQGRIDGVRGTRTMGLASSRAFPMKPIARDARSQDVE